MRVDAFRVCQVPWERKYLAGWGYVLSRDVAKYIAATVLRYERFPSLAPGWWRGLHWEDVMVGLLAGDYIGEQPTVCYLNPKANSKP